MRHSITLATSYFFVVEFTVKYSECFPRMPQHQDFETEVDEPVAAAAAAAAAPPPPARRRAFAPPVGGDEDEGW